MPGMHCTIGHGIEHLGNSKLFIAPFTVTHSIPIYHSILYSKPILWQPSLPLQRHTMSEILIASSPQTCSPLPHQAL